MSLATAEVQSPADPLTGTLEAIFARHSRHRVRSVLAVGDPCARLAAELAATGLEVVAVHRDPAPPAAPAVRDLVRSHRLVLCQAELANLNLDRHFDAIALLGNAIGVPSTLAELHVVLRVVRRHLRDGGVVVAEHWYAPALLSGGSLERIDVEPIPGGQAIRTARGELDLAAGRCRLREDVWRIAGGRVERREEARERRYFSRLELELLFERASLRLAGLCRSDDADLPPSESLWTALAIGIAG